MKNRIFSLLVIASVMLAVALSFSSCGDSGATASGFTVSDTSNPSIIKMFDIRVSSAPMLRSVLTSFSFSIISIDNEPIILKQATSRMKERNI